MKVELDSFAGTKIYPGRGRLFVRGDSKVFRFFSSKSASLFKQRKNPRRISWTVLYRRHNKKGTIEETSRRRTRRTVKSQRAVVGAPLAFLKERRSLNAEARKEQRDSAIAKAKEQKKVKEEKKRAERASAPKQSKQQLKGAHTKVQATSR